MAKEALLENYFKHSVSGPNRNACWTCRACSEEIKGAKRRAIAHLLGTPRKSGCSRAELSPEDKDALRALDQELPQQAGAGPGRRPGLRVQQPALAAGGGGGRRPRQASNPAGPARP
jgi:hypothetical protein